MDSVAATALNRIPQVVHPAGDFSEFQLKADAAAIWNTAAMGRWKLPPPLATAKACMGGWHGDHPATTRQPGRPTHGAQPRAGRLSGLAEPPWARWVCWWQQ